MGNFGLWIFATLVIGLAVTANGQEDEHGDHNGNGTAESKDAQNKAVEGAIKALGACEMMRTVNKGGACDVVGTEMCGYLKKMMATTMASHAEADEAVSQMKGKPLCREGLTCNAAGKCVELPCGCTADSARVIPASSPVIFIVNALLASLFLLACSN